MHDLVRERRHDPYLGAGRLLTGRAAVDPVPTPVGWVAARGVPMTGRGWPRSCAWSRPAVPGASCLRTCSGSVGRRCAAGSPSGLEPGYAASAPSSSCTGSRASRGGRVGQGVNQVRRRLSSVECLCGVAVSSSIRGRGAWCGVIVSERQSERRARLEGSARTVRPEDDHDGRCCEGNCDAGLGSP